LSCLANRIFSTVITLLARKSPCFPTVITVEHLITSTHLATLTDAEEALLFLGHHVLEGREETDVIGRQDRITFVMNAQLLIDMLPMLSYGWGSYA
jgi:hypothetical protein